MDGASLPYGTPQGEYGLAAGPFPYCALLVYPKGYRPIL